MAAKKPHSSPSMEVVIVCQPFGKEFQNAASEAASWALAAAEGECGGGGGVAFLLEFRGAVDDCARSTVC